MLMDLMWNNASVVSRLNCTPQNTAIVPSTNSSIRLGNRFRCLISSTANPSWVAIFTCSTDGRFTGSPIRLTIRQWAASTAGTVLMMVAAIRCARTL